MPASKMPAFVVLNDDIIPVAVIDTICRSCEGSNVIWGRKNSRTTYVHRKNPTQVLAEIRRQLDEADPDLLRKVIAEKDEEIATLRRILREKETPP